MALRSVLPQQGLSLRGCQPLVPCFATDLHDRALGTASRHDSYITAGIGAAVDRVLYDPLDG